MSAGVAKDVAGNPRTVAPSEKGSTSPYVEPNTKIPISGTPIAEVPSVELTPDSAMPDAMPVAMPAAEPVIPPPPVGISSMQPDPVMKYKMSARKRSVRPTLVHLSTTETVKETSHKRAKKVIDEPVVKGKGEAAASAVNKTRSTAEASVKGKGVSAKDDTHEKGADTGTASADLNISEAPRLHNQNSKRIWKFVSSKKFIIDRVICKKDFKEFGLYNLLESQQLLPTVVYANPFVKSIIQEFYSNLRKKTWILTWIMMLIIRALTGGSVAEWPNNKAFRASELTTKYSILHKVFLKSWMPSLHTSGVKKSLAALLFQVGHSIMFDVGQLVFDQILGCAEVESIFGALPFPSLIYGLLMKQPNIRLPSDHLDYFPPEIKISDKLVQGKHFNDTAAGGLYSDSENAGGKASMSGEEIAILRAELAFLQGEEK